MNYQPKITRLAALAAFLCLGLLSSLRAGDVDVKLTTANGNTKFSIQDSGAVDVSSVTSDGDAYFNSVGITSATVMDKIVVGDLLIEGSAGAVTDNYIAYPFTAAGAIAVKQVVVLTLANTVNTNTTASSNTVVGITVSATSGAGKIYVATTGIVTGVTCQTIMGYGQRACNGGTTAGRIGACSSATNGGIAIGKMLTACTIGGVGTVLLGPQ